jgi:hypothetical protein
MIDNFRFGLTFWSLSPSARLVSPAITLSRSLTIVEPLLFFVHTLCHHANTQRRFLLPPCLSLPLVVGGDARSSYPPNHLA